MLREAIDNWGVTWRSLATIIVQRFNRNCYTNHKIIQGEKKWIATRKISSIKAGKNKHTLSEINDKNFVIAIKSWAKSEKDNKYLHNDY